MANCWITYFRSSGWPKDTTITARATDGEGGEPFNGKVGLAMRKGENRSSDVPINMGDYHLQAEFVNGEWKVQRLDLRAFADARFDTLIIDAGKSDLPRTFRSGSADSTSRKSPTEEFWIRFTNRKPEEARDDSGNLIGYNIKTELAAGLGNKPAKKVKVFFFANNRRTSDSQQETDEDGNLNYLFKAIPLGGPDSDGFVTMAVRVVNDAGEVLAAKTLNDIPVPFPPKKEKKKNKTKIYAIEACLESPHPVAGKFLVIGKVTVDGKLTEALCLISSLPDPVTVEGRLGKIENGDDPGTFKLTPRGGNFLLAVSVTGKMATLMITALDGTFARVPMIKPNKENEVKNV